MNGILENEIIKKSSVKNSYTSSGSRTSISCASSAKLGSCNLSCSSSGWISPSNNCSLKQCRQHKGTKLSKEPSNKLEFWWSKNLVRRITSQIRLAASAIQILFYILQLCPVVQKMQPLQILVPEIKRMFQISMKMRRFVQTKSLRIMKDVFKQKVPN